MFIQGGDTIQTHKHRLFFLMVQQKNPYNLTSNRLFTQDAASYTIFVSL